MRPERHAFVWLGAAPQAPICGGERAEVEAWRRAGLPFVVASACADDPPGTVRLGLATPDKRRIGLLAENAALNAVMPPPALAEAAPCAPRDWQPLLLRVEAVCAAAGIAVSVFGSLAWTCRSGRTFLHPGSDLDLLLSPGRTDADALRRGASQLLAIGEGAPRLDGELRLADGSAVNLRELAAEPAEILVKAHGGARLVPFGSILPLLAPGTR